MIRNLARQISKKRAKIVVQRILPFLTTSKTILDIGSGTGNVTLLLREQNKQVTAVDVRGFHNHREIQPILYDGYTLPFPNRSFDTALLLMVMHHTPHPKRMIQEAKRVANHIIVIETSYGHRVHKLYTVLLDALVNLQFQAHWNSYHADNEWRNMFREEKLVITDTKRFWDSEGFLHILYDLQKT